MAQIQTFILTLMLLVFVPECLLSAVRDFRSRDTERHIECRGCRNECDKCEYGVSVSEQCGVLECRKGPDEPCGGENNNGVCGDGMICLCERCVGCSVENYHCSKSNLYYPCLPPAGTNQLAPRYMDVANHQPFDMIK